MAVAFSNFTKSTFGASSGTITYPTSPAPSVDDYVIVIVSMDGGTSTFSDWDEMTEIGVEQNTTGAITAGCAYRKWTGTEGDDFTLTIGGGAERVVAFTFIVTGHDNTQAPESAGNNNGATASDPTVPALNPTGWGAEESGWIGFAAIDDDNVTAISSYPFADNNNLDGSGTGSGHVQIAYCTEIENVENNSGGDFATDVDDTWATMQIAVRPAAAGGGGHNPVPAIYANYWNMIN